MLTVVRDKLSRLSACLNDTRTFLELMPDTVHLDVQEFVWCAHCESSVISRCRTVPICLPICSRNELHPKFGEEALGRPRASFPECTDCPSGDVVRHALQCIGVLFNAASMEHPLGDFLHPKRTFTAGCALTAALVCVALVDVVQCPNHFSVVIHHNGPSGSCH